MRLIAITGGIGSGKSIVSRILRIIGYEVYDCDSEARRLMSASDTIRRDIAARISPHVIHADGMIDRPALADIVFNDRGKLEALNEIVHSHVREDIARHAMEQQTVMFVETAILYESGLDRMVDEVWDVYADTEIRIRRVMARNNITREQVEARIAAQNHVPDTPHPHIIRIINDGVVPLLPQVERLIDTHMPQRTS